MGYCLLSKASCNSEKAKTGLNQFNCEVDPHLISELYILRNGALTDQNTS